MTSVLQTLHSSLKKKQGKLLLKGKLLSYLCWFFLVNLITVQALCIQHRKYKVRILSSKKL